MSRSTCRVFVIVLTLFILSLDLCAQIPPSSPQAVTEAGSSRPKSEITPERPVSFRLLPRNIIQDQKTIWTFPLQVGKEKHWVPVLGFIAVTAGLVALDPVDTPYFRRTPSFTDFNKIFSGRNTSLGMAIVPASFLVAGLAKHDSYAEHTGLLVAEAAADSELLSTLMKDATHRLRPSDISPAGNFSDTWFEARGSPLGTYASFPSGHAMMAFSIASVFARRYRTHRWAPWVSYGLASAVVFSRIPLQAHFPSDVFVGATFGYFIGHHVVLQNH